MSQYQVAPLTSLVTSASPHLNVFKNIVSKVFIALFRYFQFYFINLGLGKKRIEHKVQPSKILQQKQPTHQAGERKGSMVV